MPRICTVCAHERRSEIDHALVGGAPNRRIATQFAVTEQAVRRHKTAHLSAKVARAAEAREVRHAESLLDQLEELQTRTKALLDRSFPEQGRVTARDARDLAAVVAEVRKNVELMGKFTGKLRPDAQVNVLVASPEWIGLRDKLFAVLDRHPMARAEIIAIIGGPANA